MFTRKKDISEIFAKHPFTLAKVCVFATALFIASCTSVPRTTTETTKVTTIDTNDLRLAQVRHWLSARAIEAHSINVSGNLTADQGGSTNSASFTLKDKRLDQQGEHRVDSLSVEVRGPFGIKVARFLASPERYQFTDIMHSETRSGATDAKSLQDLTRLNGVTLNMMSDLVYGLAPEQDDFLPQDSLIFYSNGTHHTLVIFRTEQNATETIDFSGALADESQPIAPAALSITRYQRWNGFVNDPVNTRSHPAVSVQYGDHAVINGALMPQRIEATAGPNILTLEYTDIQLNPRDLTVRIKMPE